MALRSAGRSDVGSKRKLNEDAFLRDDATGVYFVADGMGGHAAGEVASEEAITTAHAMVKRARRELPDQLDPRNEVDVRAAMRVMESAIQAATYMVFTIAELDRAKTGMGTTISGMLFLGGCAITAQVGDSRVYQVRNGEAGQLTEDHTLIGWQLSQGLITPEEARSSPHKNIITRAVGNKEYVQVDTGVVPVEPGDVYLLCSDGLHGYLRNQEIPPIVALGCDAAVDRFIELANQRGGKDNITALLVEIS